MIGWDDFHQLGGSIWRRIRSAVDAAIAGHRSGEAGHGDLHLGHHRPAQGRPAGARQLDVRGHGGRDLRHHRPGRPALPVAAVESRVRQGADHHPAADRLHHRHRRPDRQDRRQPRRRPAHLHGRCAADLREGPGSGDDGGLARAEGQDLRLGVRRRSEDGADAAGGTSAQRTARRAVRAGRSAGVQQDQGPDGWQDPVLRLRLGGAEPGGAGVVLRRGPVDLGRLRADRDRRSHVRQRPASHPIRHGRPAGARHGDQDRRRRRDPGQGPRRDARLPQSGPGHRRVVQRRLVRHR